MIWNYLISGFRALTRDGFYAVIKVLGLTIGISSTVLIGVHVKHSFSFDRYHTNGDRVYQIVRESVRSTGSVFNRGMMGPLVTEIAGAFPHVEAASRYYDARKAVSSGDRKFLRRFAVIDTDYLKMFTFKPIRGHLEDLGSVPNSVVITRTTAVLLFETVDAIGKTLHAEHKYFPGDYEVVAVIEDSPNNTDFPVDVLSTTVRPNPWIVSVWAEWRPKSEWRPVNGFLLLKEGADAVALEAHIAKFVSHRYGIDFAAENRYRLQPLHSIHLRSADYGLRGTGDLQYLRILIGAGGFVLLIACINYANLATARSLRRAREVGMRKVLGAGRKQLVLQFMGEALLVSFLATGLAIALVQAYGSQVAATFGLHFALNEGGTQGAITMAVLAAIVGASSGLYPAFVLSRLQPIVAMRSTTCGRNRVDLRSGLVIVQFLLSISLVTGTLIIEGQLDHMREHELGFDKSQIVVSRLLNKTDLRERWQDVKNRFIGHPGIEGVSASSTDIGLWANYGQVWVEGNPTQQRLPWLSVDDDFIEMFGLELVSGTSFPSGIASETTHSFILNETAVSALGFDRSGIDVIGKRFEYIVNDAIQLRGTVSGVVKDFHTQSLHGPIEPTFLHKNPVSFRSLAFKIRKTNVEDTMAFIKNTWEELRQDEPFQASFLDEQLDALYWKEQHAAKAFVGVSAVAILIAALGLFGLVSYTTQQRTGEIGVRKAIGATEKDILRLLGVESLSLIVISSVLAIPLTYFFADAWLQSFAYRIPLGWQIFATGVVIAMAVGAAAISMQAIRAARQDPVKALRQDR